MTKPLDVNLINGIALAFEGDAVYSLYIRRHLIFQGQTKPNQLHRLATRYVSAKAQASLIEKMLEQELLTEKELDIYRLRSSHGLSSYDRGYRSLRGTDCLVY